MRSLIPALLLILSLAACQHADDPHLCDPTCCASCCSVSAEMGEVPSVGGLTAAQWAQRGSQGNAAVRQEVAAVMAGFGPEALCHAKGWLTSSDPGLQVLGATLLREMGSAGASAGPELAGLLNSNDVEVRTAALQALAAMDPKTVAAARTGLEDALQSPHWILRYHGAKALAAGDWRSFPSADLLEHAAHHDLDNRVRTASLDAYNQVWSAWLVHQKVRKRGHHAY